MRYEAYGPEVNAILDVARAARRMQKVMPDASSADVIEDLVEPASAWVWSLIDIIMDHEERDVNGDATKR
jgi:hypothetical protein